MVRSFKTTLIPAILLAFGVADLGWSQERFIYQNRTILVDQPVTKTKLVAETVYENHAITEEVPVIETETRYRRVITNRPVVKNKILEERYEVYKPVTETSVKNVEIEETVYQDVTEMRTQQVWVEKPVQETRYRDEQVIVQRPIESMRYEPQQVTTYRPQTQFETSYTQSEMMAIFPGSTQVEWLRRGYYFDSTRNAYLYRRPGFHWVNQPSTIASQPVLVPQTTAKTVLVPETQTSYKPVMVTETRETMETRRVPYTVETTQRVLQDVEVPVVVRKPVVQRRVEQRPETTVKYQTEEVINRTPFQETTWETVEVNEPYQVQVQKNITRTRMVQIPRTVYKEVPYAVTEKVRRVVTEKIPVDEQGRPILSTPTDAALSGNSQQSTQRPVLEGEGTESFGTFRPAEESRVLKSSQIVDPPIEPASGESQPTSQAPENGSGTVNGSPQSVLTLESKPLRPIGERPRPVEADMPPQIDPPKIDN